MGLIKDIKHIEKSKKIGEKEMNEFERVSEYLCRITYSYSDVIKDKKGDGLSFEDLHRNFINKLVFSQEKKLRYERMSVEEYEQLKDKLNGDIPFPMRDWEKVGDIYIHGYSVYGEYNSAEKEVVLYVRTIIDSYKNDENRAINCIITTFIHELFHAYFHFVTEQKLPRKYKYNYILEIEEAMAEFCTLVFLKEKAIIAEDKWKEIFKNAKEDICNKQKHVGNLSAYGFGGYLFDEIKDDASFTWINQYIQKLGDIDENDSIVKKYIRKVRAVHYMKKQKDCKKLLHDILFN